MERERGFTLIELSIVLVIIGLIVGGILVGQDLIKAAEIRAQVSQFEKLQTSVNVFKIKYGGIPGDFHRDRAAQLGFFSVTHPSGGSMFQNGNGLVIPNHESMYFWRHMSDAQLIDGSYATAESGNPLIAATGIYTSASTAGNIKRIFPPAKIGRGNYLYITSWTGMNIIQLMGMYEVNTSGLIGEQDAVTPIEAMEIDTKMDDGFPEAGRIHSTHFLGMPGCVTGGRYDIGTTYGNVPGCQMFLFRAF